MAEKQVSCSGTIMGTKRGLNLYLDAFIQEVELRYEHGNYCRIDQGTHNYVLYEKLGMQRGNVPGTKFRLFDFAEGPIITVGVPCQQMDGGRWLKHGEKQLGMRVTLDEEGCVFCSMHAYAQLCLLDCRYFLNKDKSRVPIVHQHERCTKLFGGAVEDAEGRPPHPFLNRSETTRTFPIRATLINKQGQELQIVRVGVDGEQVDSDETTLLANKDDGSEFEMKLTVQSGETLSFYGEGKELVQRWVADLSGKRSQKVKVDGAIKALFKNRGRNSIKVFWVGTNEDGSENLVHQADIPSHKWTSIVTYPGHQFVVVLDGSKGELVRWTADAEKGDRQEVAVEPANHDEPQHKWFHHSEF
jgi:hypothetical protein